MKAIPRNSTGAYSLPSGTLATAGDTILVSQHNPAMVDIAGALTSSVDRGGTGGMLAPLDMNGFKVKNAAPGTEPTDVATLSQVKSAPVGAILDYAGTEPPVGWLLCGGQSLSRTTYSTLFDVIGTTYGSADADSFNLPDCRGRVTAGVDFTTAGMANRLTDDTMTPSGADLGATGGTETVALTDDQMPSHDHHVSLTTNSAGAHTHTYLGTTTSSVGAVIQSSGTFNSGAAATNSAGSHTHTASGTTTDAGGGEAHPNVQPTILFNKIIYAGTD